MQGVCMQGVFRLPSSRFMVCPTPHYLTQEAGRHGGEKGGCRPSPWAAAMSQPHGGKSAVENQADVHLKKLSTGQDQGEGKGRNIESRKPEQEGSEQKARGGAWCGFLSLWASQGRRLISQMPLITTKSRDAGHEGGGAFKGPQEVRILMKEKY